MLRARLFGPLAVEVGGRPVPEIAGLRPRAVLAWLLLHPGQHSRARVAARFWPDVLDTSARASLRNVLWTIRSALDAVDGGGYLEAGRDHVRITDRLPRQVDTEEFARLAGRDDPEALRQCFALADAPLLSDLADDWVLEARDEYRERTAEIAVRLAEDASGRGDPQEAVSWARQALIRMPLRESVHRLLMRCLAEAGEPAEALAAYRRCEAELSAEFGTVPSSETRALAERLRTAARAAHPPPAGPEDTPPGPPGHAPAVTPEDDTSPVPRRAPRPEIPLIGREEEFTQLLTAWEHAKQGHGGVLVVNGGGGLGKSRLVSELAARAVQQGARHGAGTVFELAGAPPYAPWSEALRELLVDVPPPPAAAAWPSDLARLCRSVEWRWGRPAGAPAPDPEQERAWLFEAVAEALAWCAHDRPLLLVLEDIHLADRATIALLAYAGRQLTRLPVLLVTTRRPGAARHDLALALDALARREALGGEITLAPLDRAHTDVIVEATSPGLPAATRERVTVAAEGNPLLARQAARAAATGQDLSQGLGTWLRAPLARLSEPARLLVDVVAAAGRPVELGEAAGLTGAEPLAAAVAGATQQDLLEVGDRKVQFTHTLVREACYAELEPVRRDWLHGRIADLLQSRTGRAPAEVARHLLLAGRAAEARGYLLTAADQARSLGALDEAVGFLREAATLADETSGASEIWLSLAEVESWRGSRQEHDAAFDHATSLLEPALEPASLAAAYVLRGRCLRTTLCFPRDSLAAYERAQKIIDDAGVEAPELRALALAGRGWVEAASGDVGRGEQLVAEAEALPEVATDPGLTAELQLARGAALLRSHRYVDAERASERASELAIRAGRREIAHVGMLQSAVAATSQGALARTLSLVDRVLRARSGTGQRAEALAVRAYALSRAGRHDEALAAAEEEIALLTRIGSPQVATAIYDVGSLALAAGRHMEAISRLSEALSADSTWFPRALARLRLAEARLHTGDATGAAAELERFPYEPVGPADLPETLVPLLERVQALVAAAEGDTDRARRLFDAAVAGWRRLRDTAPQDTYAASLTELGRSAVAGRLEPGVELGRTLADLALLLGANGEADRARELAREATALAGEVDHHGYLAALRRAAALIETAQ